MDELEKLLGDFEKKSEIINFFKAEKTKIEESFTGKVGEKGRENKQLRDKVKAFEGVLADVGVDVTKQGSLEEQVDNISEQLKGMTTGGEQDLKQIKAENARMKLKLSEFEIENKNLSESEKKYKSEKLKNKVQGVFSKAKAIDYNDTMELMIMKGEIGYDDAGQIICKVDDQNLSLDKGVESLITTGRISVSNDQKSGAGGGGAGGEATKPKSFSSFL